MNDGRLPDPRRRKVRSGKIPHKAPLDQLFHPDFRDSEVPRNEGEEVQVMDDQVLQKGRRKACLAHCNRAQAPPFFSDDLALFLSLE